MNPQNNPNAYWNSNQSPVSQNYRDYYGQVQTNMNTRSYAPAYLSGRMVNKEDEIRPNEVPMDGSPSFFPQADGQCVYMKWWNNNGSIGGRTYVWLPPEAEQNNIQDNTQAIFGQILERLDRIEKSMNRPNKNSYHNKQRFNNSNVNKEEDKHV